ncbi:hypothetical protein ACIQAD_29365 [Streptomyces sp. NPDC088551]|uniref:hypothetical protein n=1 Tax=Streptomyces sp. NPDC088551 TaxID=3365863 RepID=UPI00380A2BDB
MLGRLLLRVRDALSSRFGHPERVRQGAALLTAAVWHRRELARQFIAEGGC